jgi:hypothetical protein
MLATHRAKRALMKGYMSIFDRIFGSGKEKPTKPQSEQPKPPKTVLIKGVVGDMPPLEIGYSVDVKTFLSQDPLPYLWPDNEKHRKGIDNYASGWGSKPQDVLRYHWTTAFLSHPNQDVVIETLKTLDLKGGSHLGLFPRLASMLARANPLVAREAARVVWSGGDEMLDLTINCLGSRGDVPSGIEPDEGKRGGEFLRDTCPVDRKAVFQKLTLEAFGPVTAGIPGQYSQKVVFKHGGLRKVASGQLEQLEVHVAANKLDALRFLESRSILNGPLQFPKTTIINNAERLTTRELEKIKATMPKVTYDGVHRFLVETPEGIWGKDNSGIYKSDSSFPA